MRTPAPSQREVTEHTGTPTRVAPRVPVFAEMIGYVGGGLLVAAAMVFIGSQFGDYPIGVQIVNPRRRHRAAVRPRVDHARVR